MCWCWSEAWVVMHISPFTRLYHRLRGPNPLHPSVWEGRLRPITFRRYEPRDLDRCLEIYALNQPGRFPEGVESDYKSSLEEQRTYFLVGEKNDQVVATGGMYYFNREGIAVLCYGLVHPEHQGLGIGAALALTRLALLTPLLPSHQVMIFAVEKSFDYYRRFGSIIFRRGSLKRAERSILPACCTSFGVRYLSAGSSLPATR